MAKVKNFCNSSECYANSLDNRCLLKRGKWFGYFCGDYYPKIKSDDDDIFQHLFHRHNLKTRNLSIFAIVVSTISLIFASYSMVSSNAEKQSIEQVLEKISQSVANIGNNPHFSEKTDLEEKDLPSIVLPPVK